MTTTSKTDVLLAIYIAAIVCAELLGGKIFTAFGINASVGIFIVPLTYTLNDIIFEVHGKERAKSFMRAGFITLLFVFCFTLVSILLPPAGRFENSNQAYTQIFSTSLRIIVASLTAFWISERLDILIFQRLKEKLAVNYGLWFRNNVSNIFSQFIDTVLFIFLAFYSTGRFWFVVSLIIPYWLLKCLFSALDTPLTYAGVAWLRKDEPSKTKR